MLGIRRNRRPHLYVCPSRYVSLVYVWLLPCRLVRAVIQECERVGEQLARIQGDLKPAARDALLDFLLEHEAFTGDPPKKFWAKWMPVADAFEERAKALDKANVSRSQADRYMAFLEGLKELDEMES